RSAGRTRHLDALRAVVVPVRRGAGEAGLVQLGKVATDGTQLQGNASRHNAMRSGSMRKAAARVREAIAALGTRACHPAAEADAALGRRRGDDLPPDRARRAARWAPLAAARPRLEARAQAEAEAARQPRAIAEAQRQRTGPQRRGKVPQPVQEPPADQAQTNC